MRPQPRRRLGSNLRFYHFGATLVATGIAAFALAWVHEIEHDTTENLKQTYCNQGLLTLATLDIWTEDQLSNCPPGLLRQLRTEYQ